MIWFIFLSLASSKTVKNVLELSEETPSHYLTKFGVDLGQGKWDIRLKLVKGKKSHNPSEYLEIPLILLRDSDWNDSVLKCSNTGKEVTQTLKIPSDGSWSDNIQGTLGEQEEPHIWFFVISDCSQALGTTSKLRFELNIKSGDESELPVEMKGMKRIYFIVCFLFTCLLGRNIFKLYKHFTEEEEVEAILVMLNIAVVCEFISMVFYILHISAYENNGKGVAAFEFFGSSGNFISNFIMIFLLLLIAQGWSITFRDFPSPEVYISVMIILAFMHFILTAVEMSLSDSYYLFSDFDGLTGWLIFGSRVVMLVWLYWNVEEIIEQVPPNVNLFLRRFKLAAAGYILALPGLILLAQVLPPYKRHKFIVGSNILVQGFAMFALSWLFTSKKQLYKISVVSSSILPGHKSHNY